jgi:hypothetical protein
MIGGGRIGGKAAGMLLARRILLTNNDQTGTDFAERLDDHDSFYIGSDVFFTFLVNNNLFRLRLQLTCNSATSDEEFKEIEQRFLAGRFSTTIQEQFRAMLDYYGQAPIIVRSSSLLEDSFGNAFAGKYRSVLQIRIETRLADFMRPSNWSTLALTLMSMLSQQAGLGSMTSNGDFSTAFGMPYRHYFFPTLAGVAFPESLRLNDRIDPARHHPPRL